MLISVCYQYITKEADNESTECCGSRSRTGSVRKRTYVYNKVQRTQLTKKKQSHTTNE